MKLIQISIPDKYYNKVKKFVDTIPDATIEDEFELTAEQLHILNERSAMPLEKYFTIEEANARLKSKYV